MDTKDSSQPSPADYQAAAVRNPVDVGQKVVVLANAMPAEKFSWHPGGEGLPTVSESFLVAATQYYHRPHAWGALRAASYEYGGDVLTRGRKAAPLHQLFRQKPDVIRELVDSTSYLQGIMKTLSDSDLQTPVKLFGREVFPCNDRVVMVGDVHEQLARSIDYARMNSVTLPLMDDWQQQQIRRGLRTVAND
jgi:hypothetical protein